MGGRQFGTWLDSIFVHFFCFFVWTSSDSQWASQNSEHCTGEIVPLKKGDSLICVHRIDRLPFLKHLSSGFLDLSGSLLDGRLLGSWIGFGFVNFFCSFAWRSSDTQWDVHIIGTDGGDGMHFAWSTCLCGFSCRSESNASWIPLQKHPRCKWSDYNCLTFGIKQTYEINRHWNRLVLCLARPILLLPFVLTLG